LGSDVNVGAEHRLRCARPFGQSIEHRGVRIAETPSCAIWGTCTWDWWMSNRRTT